MSNEPTVKAFNKALFSIRESRAPVSKQRIVDITKAAMNAIKYYKHVVFSVEKFISKCDVKLKIPIFYVIDSIVRQGQKQFKGKDVFGPRFAINLATTLEQVLNCAEEDKLRVVRVVNLWRTHSVFSTEVLDRLINYCSSIGLEVDIHKVEMKVKGEKADMSIYDNEYVKIPKKAAPRTPPDEGLNESIENQYSDIAPINGLSERDLVASLQRVFPHLMKNFAKNEDALRQVIDLFETNMKQCVDKEEVSQIPSISNILTRDFDYSDEEDEEDRRPKTDLLPRGKIESFANAIFADYNFQNAVQSIHNAIPSVINELMQNQNNTSFMPAENADSWTTLQSINSALFRQAFNPSANGGSHATSNEASDVRHKSHKKKRSRSPDRRSSDRHSSDPRRKKHRGGRRSRSPSNSESREREKERRRLGIPVRCRENHLLLASRTIWFGRLPTSVTEKEISNAVKESGAEPERINIISSRACAYVTMPQRRSAFKIMDRLSKDMVIRERPVKLSWATGPNLQKGDRMYDYWDQDRGICEIPHNKLPNDISTLVQGFHLVVDTLPSHLKGKFSELNALEQSVENIIPTAAIPTPDQMAVAMQGNMAVPIFTQQPGDSANNITQLPLPHLGFPALPGLIQPNVLASVIAQQQQQQALDILNALHQNPSAAIISSAPNGQNLSSSAELVDNSTGHPRPRFNGNFGNRGFGRPRFPNNPEFRGPPPRGDFRGRPPHFRGPFRPGRPPMFFGPRGSSPFGNGEGPRMPVIGSLTTLPNDKVQTDKSLELSSTEKPSRWDNGSHEEKQNGTPATVETVEGTEENMEIQTEEAMNIEE